MMMKDLAEKFPILKEMQKGREVVWINLDKVSFAESIKDCELSIKDIEDAQARLQRFAPFIMRCFPETRDKGGLIESALTDIPSIADSIRE